MEDPSCDRGSPAIGGHHFTAGELMTTSESIMPAEPCSPAFVPPQLGPSRASEFPWTDLRQSIDSRRAILRILFVEMAAQQSVTRKKGKEWLILARGASPGKNTQSESLPKQSRNLFSAWASARAEKRFLLCGLRHGAMPPRGWRPGPVLTPAQPEKPHAGNFKYLCLALG